MIRRHKIVEEDLDRIIESNLAWKRFEGKTILITGAGGFLPAYAVETILRLNERILNKPASDLALVRDETKARKRFACYQSRTELKFIVQDVCEPLVWDSPIDFIIHAASNASPKYFGIDPVGTFTANVIGTYNLLELARMKSSQGFLFVSSSEVYGQVNADFIPTGETTFGYLDPAQVRSCYAESKRMGETMCVSYARQFGIPTKIVRPFHTYGPGMHLDDGRVFADFVADVVHHRDIVIKSDGGASRSFCYLGDVIEAIFTVMLEGEIARPYNVGDEQSELSVASLAELLVNLFPERNLKVVKQKVQSDNSYLASPITRICPDTRAVRALGWKPVTSVTEGFLRTVRSFE